MRRAGVIAVLVAVAVGSAGADTIKCSKVSNAATQGPFGKGYCAVVHGKNPESWVRGSAELDTATSVMTIIVAVNRVGTKNQWLGISLDSVEKLFKAVGKAL